MGDTSATGHFSRMIVDFPEPIGAMIHIRILIMQPGGHLPEQIGTVSHSLKIAQNFLRRQRALLTQPA